MSLRLVSGAVRGRSIEVPPGVRPTEARLREALLSIWRDKIPGSRFLDLFAGSGAVGLEALGLGASRVCFVDEAPRVLSALRRNLKAVSIEGAGELVRGSLPRVLARRPEGEFDLIFADPPYAFDRWPGLVEAAGKCLAAEGEIAAEHSVRVPMPEEVGRLRLFDRRRYGESGLAFYRFVERG